MPAINFPKSTYTTAEGASAHGWAASPSNGDTDSENGRNFTFSGTRSLWVLNTNSAHSVAGAATYTFDGFKWTASNIPDSSNTIFTSDTPLDGEVLKFESSGSTFVFDSPQNLIPAASASQNGMMTAAQFTKLAGIETGATADLTAAEIKTAYESNSDTNEFSDAEQTKLAGIETGATADQTNAEIKTAYESNADTNAFTDAEKTKLTGVEAGATADQTAAEIKSLYESNSNTNEFSDAEQTKLAGIEAAADVTDATNVDAAGAVMNSDTSTASMSFVVDEDNMSSNSATKVPTQQSVKSYVDNQVASVVDTAPAALDTLNELAAALGDDANFSTTVSNSIGTKLPLSGGTMTGNIVMSGSETVDGRDLSADGAKLDGIASGAEVNVQSDWNASSGDAQILNKPTIPAAYTNSSVDAHLNQSSASTGQTLIWNGSDYSWGTPAASYGNSNVDSHLNRSSASTGQSLTWNGSDYAWATVSGSGGDADTVDGIHASSFIRSDTQDSVTGPIEFANGTLQTYDPPGTSGSDTATDVAIALGSGHRIVGHSGGYIRSLLEWNASGDITFGQGSTAMITGINLLPGASGQAKVNGNRILTVANEGSGNGIDADTVDGIQAASFLRSDAADVKSAGDLRWNDGVYAKFGTNEDLEIAHTSGNSHIRTVNGSAGDLYIQSQGTNHDLYLRATDDVFIQPQGGENGIKVIGDGGVELYHNNSKKFETTSVGNTSTGPLTINGTGQYLGNWGYNTLVLTDTSGYPGITWQHGTNNWLQRMESTTDMQWAFRSGGNYTERMQLTTGGVLTVNSNTVWHAGNDGSGSGLDADTVDGIQGANFLRSDIADSAVGRINFNANATNNWDTIATASGSQGCLEIYNTGSGNDAFMTFHTGGDFACYFGLDADSNSLAVGGWSMGANKYTIWHAGNDGAGSGLDADTLDGVESVNFMGRVGTYWNVNNWLQFSSTHGLYYPNNNSYHVYLDGAYLRIQNSANSNGIKIITNNSSQRGFLYADNGSNIGLLNSGGSWSLKCDNSGNVTATGNVTAYSDLRIKENIRTVDNALDKVQSMRGVYFDRKDTGKASVGVIAQEIEQILPEVVETQDTRTDENKDGLSDLKTVSYGNIVGVLIEAIKELRAEVAELKEAN